MIGPERGEVWLVDLGWAGKQRPAVVLSVRPQDQDRALVTLVAPTTSVRGSRFEVHLADDFLGSGVYDAENILTLPLAKML